ncbi:MAG: hypothetical protein JETT_2514 [Candidatus Jettenia ecosi]|uniref:Capsule polysaccharide biosynthesis protein n=1 Tax=Candidatus Jettenia ecosi TaxID=2494326 RepID=A0A533Q983_9BACT|nr:MAG: hypothetical protein JETT_2514 [Candidatus Jettenia ecosi]
MNYVFQVRHWNIDFFLFLEKNLLSNHKEVNIVWFTMEKEAFTQLNMSHKNVFYLPAEFTKHRIQDKTKLLDFDHWMYETYGYGVEFIYEIERFKPKAAEKLNFINAHIDILHDLIPEKSKMVALSCEHFVYLISTYINKMKGGINYFIQPCGFPLNTQVIMKNPWNLFYFRTEPMDETPLDAYIASLTQSPMESIHYMKPQKMITLHASILQRIKKTYRPKLTYNMFSYLEAKPRNIIPGRFMQKKHIPYKFDYIQEKDLASLKEKGRIFYFPLQFEPEMTILAYSPWFKSQLEVIRLIGQSLKQGDILLLKENPKMIGKRGKHYYAEISQYNQVLWADPGLNSRNIIRNSFKVISITGTASIEAACLGINSMIFGYPPFKKLLIEEPVSDQKICDFIQTLYKAYTSEEIIRQVKKEWPEFSKSVFFGNFIPQYINDKFTISNSAILAGNFLKEVFK